MTHKLLPEDDARLDALIDAILPEYQHFLTDMIKRYGPDDIFTHNAIKIALAHTGALVATAFAAAVWSAESARKFERSEREN